jgi:hypothetical protein
MIRYLKWGIKFLVSGSLIFYLLWKIKSLEGFSALLDNLVNIKFLWVAGAFLIQMCAMASTVIRWRFLLLAQGLTVPPRHLISTFLIGRFIGSFLPSTIGLDAYRAYDIARHSGQTARSISVILIEKIIGAFVLSILVLVTAFWGIKFVGTKFLGITGILFILPATLSFLILVHPSLVRKITYKFFDPQTKIGKKISQAAEASIMFEKRKGRLLAGILMGFPVHICTCLLFFFTAHALGVDIGVRDVLFIGPLMIVATVIPLSIAGIGIREGVFVFFLIKIGVGISQAALLAFLGYLVGEIISLFGGILLILRPADYRVRIKTNGSTSAVIT